MPRTLRPQDRALRLAAAAALLAALAGWGCATAPRTAGPPSATASSPPPPAEPPVYHPEETGAPARPGAAVPRPPAAVLEEAPPMLGASPEDLRPSPPGGVLIGAQIVGPKTYLGPIPTMTVILRPDQGERSRAFCRAFTTELRTLGQQQAAHPNDIVVPIRWLSKEAPTEDPADCDALVAGYDYYRAAVFLGVVATGNVAETGGPAEIAGRGPFVIEEVADAAGLHYALLDLSTTPDFRRFAPFLQKALAAQANALAHFGGVPDALASRPGAAAAGGAKPDPLPSWAREVCDRAQSPLANVIFAALAVIPPMLAVTTPLKSVVAAGCPKAA